MLQDETFVARPLGTFGTAQRLTDEGAPSAPAGDVLAAAVATAMPSAPAGASVTAAESMADVTSATAGSAALGHQHYPTPVLPTRSVELGTLPTGVAPEPQPYFAGYLAVAKSPVITPTAGRWRLRASFAEGRIRHRSAAFADRVVRLLQGRRLSRLSRLKQPWR